MTPALPLSDRAPRAYAIPDVLIERFLVEDVSDDERALVLEALERDRTLAAHVDERRASQRAFDLPPLAFVDAPAARALSLRLPGLAAACAVACALVFTVVRDPEEHGATPSHDVRARGTALPLEVAVRRGDRVFTLDDVRTLLRPGDAVRITVHAPHAGFASAVLVDERGAADLVYDAVPVPRGASLLPDSLVLDDAVGRERLIVVVAAAPLPGARVVAAVRSSDSGALTIGDARGVVEWHKEPAP